MALLNFYFNLSLLLTLLSGFALAATPPVTRRDKGAAVSGFPLTCNRIECPSYDVIHIGNGFEIRRYNSSMWATTSPIQDISLVEATRTGFKQLFNYIQGENKYKEKIEMTAPVLTKVSPSDGPFCKSSFNVSFYVPKKNQANPAPAKGLHIDTWGPTYVAVRQFSGFVKDETVGQEAAALSASVAGTIWSDAIDKTRAGDVTTNYIVAQYNSPFEPVGRVNEIWFKFYMKDGFSM